MVYLIGSITIHSAILMAGGSIHDVEKAHARLSASIRVGSEMLEYSIDLQFSYIP
jgi:hypothetical protein